MDRTARQTVEHVARLSYGKLVALLAVRTRNIAMAEDAVSGALLRALEEWPSSGVPQNPEAWLLTTARRIDIDRWHRAVTARDGAPHLALLEDERLTLADTDIPDHRLRLMFACSHPAIEERLRTPLMLQVVLGLNARRIASAFLLPPATLGQRLSRAKVRISDAGIKLEVPDAAELPSRIEAVLNAVYIAYTLGADAAFSDDRQMQDLSLEALWLARLICGLLPESSEALSLLALILFSEARRAARRSLDGSRFIPLAEQDVRLWNMDMIEEANSLLRGDGRAIELGRFGLEAAIQAVHVARGQTGSTDWEAIEHLYRGLVVISPTIGARIGHAVAVAERLGPKAGLELLDDIPVRLVDGYPSYWAARAHFEGLTQCREQALASYQRAIGLTEDPSVRRFLAEARLRLLDG